MAPKSKLILIMAALSLRKKKICALALLVMLDKVENEDTGRRFWVRKIYQERKKYDLYRILTDELRLFDKEYFFHFVQMTPQHFEHLLLLVGPHLQRTTTKMREPISPAESLVLTLRSDSFFTFGGKKCQWKQIVAEMAGIFVECSFKFISRLNAYDKISKKLVSGARLTIVS